MILVCILIPTCLHRSEQKYWKKSSVSSMKLFGLLWYTSMRHNFIVGDGKLWSIYGWICSNYPLVILLSTAWSNISSLWYSSMMFSSFTLKNCLVSFLLSVVFMWSYGPTNRTEIALGIFLTNVALGGPDI